MHSKLYYEARIAFGFPALMPLLSLPIYILIDTLSRPMKFGGNALSINLELLAPLAAGLSAAYLMSIEREERFDELRRTYGEHSWQIPLLRLWGAILGLGISLLLSVAILAIRYPVDAIIEAVLPALAPAFYLIGLAFLSNNLSGSYWLSAALIALYWFLEYQSQGQLTTHLYLFQHTFPIDFVHYENNRATLFGLGFIYMLLNIGYSTWRRKQGG